MVNCLPTHHHGQRMHNPATHRWQPVIQILMRRMAELMSHLTSLSCLWPFRSSRIAVQKGATRRWYHLFRWPQGALLFLVCRPECNQAI